MILETGEISLTREQLLAFRDRMAEPSDGHCYGPGTLAIEGERTLSWEEQLELGEKACQGMLVDELMCGPTDEEMILLDDKTGEIQRMPGMDNASIKDRIKRRDEERKRVCGGCAVKEACLQVALAKSSKEDGPLIMGDTTLAERKKLRRAARKNSKLTKNA